MAVVVQDKHGWLLDQKRFIEGIYWQKEIENESQSETKFSKSNFQFKHVSFDIFTPFKLDSQFVKYMDIQSGKDTLRKNKRKRKRVNTNNDGISNDDDSLHTKLHEAYQSITNCASKVNYFMKHSELPLDNNLAARELARSVRDIDVVGLLPEGVGEGRTTSYLSGSRVNVSASDVANRLVHVTGTEPTDTCIMSLHGQRYLLPSNSCFLWSDIHLIHTLKDTHEKYDLIVLDPPWENKSAKRKKSYWSVDNDTLLDLPIPSLSTPGALIVMWVTDNRRHQQFVTQTLFPHWSVKHVATWHWLKVTRGGDLVTELDNSHKKPYETILIGQYCPADVVTTTNVTTTNVPDARVVMSVPSTHHSQKPCLLDVLSSYLPSPSRRLELFARNLLPGWTSWGNEVFKYQHMSLFEEIPGKDT